MEREPNLDSEVLRERLDAVLQQIERNAAVTEAFVDKDRYRLYLCTLWSNLVLEPDQLGLEVNDLEQAFETISEKVKSVLGEDDPIRGAFRFISSPAGEREMNRAKLTRNHRDMLLYFSSMILDPDGHKKWIDQLKEQNPRIRPTDF